jgi:dethiobiotin synthetase
MSRQAKSHEHGVIRFVTGTDTGVGKTVVSAVLCREVIASGRRAAYYKPVQTGCGMSDGGDAGFVAAAAPGVTVREGLRMAEPLAPAVAAERAGVRIDVDGLLREAAGLAAEADALVVEGAGGLLVPLWQELTMADLAAGLGASLVVVARPGLGTLNHTALTLEAARARRLGIAGVVVSGWPEQPEPVEETNLERLAAMAPLLGVVPHLGGLDTGRPGLNYDNLRLITLPEPRR